MAAAFAQALQGANGARTKGCFLCGQEDHMKKDCPQRNSQARGGRQSQPVQFVKVEEAHPNKGYGDRNHSYAPDVERGITGLAIAAQSLIWTEIGCQQIIWGVQKTGSRAFPPRA